MGQVYRTSWDTTSADVVFKAGYIKKTFDNTARKVYTEASDLFKMIKTDEKYTDYFRMAGLGSMSEIGEGQTIPISTPIIDDTLRFTQAEYGLGFRVTWMMKKTNKMDLVKKATSSLSKRMKEDKDIEVFKMWNNATSTTYASGYDGYALAHNTHTTLDPDGQTYDNYLNSALSVSTLETALNYFAAVYDDRGYQYPVIPSKLVVNYQNWVTANEILKSDGKAHELSNTANIVSSEWDLKPYKSIRITSSTAWFLTASPSEEDYGPRVITLGEPDLIIKDAPDTSRDTVVTSHQSFAYGFDDPRLIVVGDT
jgi:hypothetical protein